ncbi:CUB and sushi domain-containing protein 3-like isoform X5 [Dreissena polymorpha]|uniref:CUB and sushi domain-containing protein 3-like isoform X5 n=1 Tax=Dreissena polymorpha TaxID=45954 RepID=UPI002264E75A|nr:CUB and sushi domain-containing protein 3-like isoform X5 [Dreissena polymorpha]
MHIFKFLLFLVSVSADKATFEDDVRQTRVTLDPALDNTFESVPDASCTFTDKSPCRFNISTNWVPEKGPTRAEIRPGAYRTVSQMGQDDEFYMVFWGNTTDALNSSSVMTSPLLSAGSYQIKFWFIVPIARTQVSIETSSDVTNDDFVRWQHSYTSRPQLTWINQTVSFNESNCFRIFIRVYEVKLGIVGIDNIEVLRERDCHTFPINVHGHVSTNSTTYRTSVTITCDTGYNLNGNSTSICESNGHWSSIGQTCSLVDCKQHPVPSYGRVSTSSTTYGTVVTIICDTGYIISGNSTSSCESNGRWSGSAQRCTPIDCHTFPINVHGHVSTNSTTYRTSVTITCDTGYNLNGNSTSICESNGHWSSIGQTCSLVDCKQHPVPSYGRLSTSSTTYGSVVTIICDTGYIISGNSTSSCESNGRWSGSAQRCTPIDCHTFPINVHGHVSTNSTTYRTSVTITCDTGYNLNGNSTSICESNGHWSSIGQTCSLVDCKQYPVPSYARLSTNSTTYGTVVTITCDTGYIISGNSRSSCESNGRWSGSAQRCTPIDCHTFPINVHGHVSTNSTTYKTSVIITCETGYNLYGNSTSICESNGHWSSIGQTCTPVDCHTFPITLHGHVSTNSTTYRTSVTITCDTGYNLNGNSTSICESNGHWNSIGQTCTPVDCHTFPITLHGHVSTNSTTYRTSVTITCDTGYNLNGKSTSICESNGNWSSIGQTCTPVDCKQYPVPSYGRLSTSSTTYGTVVTITCDTGYMINGNSTSSCKSNGRWSSTGQHCSPIECYPFPITEHGHLSTNSTTYRTSVTITCDTGYNVNGNSTSVCESNGHWSSTSQTCIPVDCKQFPNPSNGHVFPTSTTFGIVVTITCEPGYILNGSSMAMCGSNGNWNSTGQTCSREVITDIPKTTIKTTTTTTSPSSIYSTSAFPATLLSTTNSRTRTAIQTTISSSSTTSDKISFPIEISKTTIAETSSQTLTASLFSSTPKEMSTSLFSSPVFPGSTQVIIQSTGSSAHDTTTLLSTSLSVSSTSAPFTRSSPLPKETTKTDPSTNRNNSSTITSHSSAHAKPSSEISTQDYTPHGHYANPTSQNISLASTSNDAITSLTYYTATSPTPSSVETTRSSQTSTNKITSSLNNISHRTVSVEKNHVSNVTGITGTASTREYIKTKMYEPVSTTVPGILGNNNEQKGSSSGKTTVIIGSVSGIAAGLVIALVGLYVYLRMKSRRLINHGFMADETDATFVAPNKGSSSELKMDEINGFSAAEYDAINEMQPDGDPNNRISTRSFEKM